ASLGSDAKRQGSRPSIVERDVHADRGEVAIGWQLDVLRGDDASVILDDERHLLAAVAALPNEHVGHEGASLECRPCRLDAPDLDILVELVTPNPDREDRDGARA